MRCIKARRVATHMKALRTGASSIGAFPQVVIEANVVAAVILRHASDQALGMTKRVFRAFVDLSAAFGKVPGSAF